jgi:molybdate transport system regulatory protein
MHKKKSAGQKHCVRPRLRVMCGSEIALGPGRVDLLELIGETGSLRAAAERMGISYMRAWNLVRYTNRCFSEPMVEAVRGGKAGGGAELTDAGREVVALYRLMEKESQRAVKQSWVKLRKLLKRS